MSFMRHTLPAFVVAVGLVLGSTAAASAAVYLTPTQARDRLLPPHDSVRTVVWRPSAPQTQTFQARLGYALPRDRYTWHVAEQAGTPVGYLLVDNERGKHEPITFAVALDADGTVQNVAVCVYRETRGDAVKHQTFMQQFVGHRPERELRLDREIVHVSGATISSRSAVTVVNRALALWLLAFGPPPVSSAAAAE